MREQIELWYFTFDFFFQPPKKDCTDDGLVNTVEQESVSVSLMLVMSDISDKGQKAFRTI